MEHLSQKLYTGHNLKQITWISNEEFVGAESWAYYKYHSQIKWLFLKNRWGTYFFIWGFWDQIG